jgi:uncharacterized protein YndB with AHSA1/START domain
VSAPIVETAMLIRRPVADVFEAFVDPGLTSRFWFSKGSARLTQGAQVLWDWEMYGVQASVDVKAIEPNRRIAIEWGNPGDEGASRTSVEWMFQDRGDGTTFVTITNAGFTGDDAVKNALGSMQGFTLVLAGAKAFLEHGVELDLVPDRYPDAIKAGWRS